MSVVLFRIDDRLLHGQVIEGWLKNINIDTIIVANDIVANDEMQKMLMSMAVPCKTTIYIDTVDSIIDQWKRHVFEHKKILMLVSNPKDAHSLIENGIHIDSLNVGGMHFVDGKKQILEAVSVDEADVHYFYALSYMGIKIEARTVPRAEKIDLIKELRKNNV